MKQLFRKKMVWTFTTYFTEGFPFSIIRPVSSVFFREMRVSLEYIGLTSLFGLPWILKFLWAPLLDQYGTKRRWLLATQGVLLGVMLLASLFASLPFGVPLIAGLFFFGAFVAATHDTAIDGYYLEALSEENQAKFVGYRVMAYRIAMMTGTGVVVTIGTTVGWSVAFGVATVLFGGLFVIHLLFLKEVESPRLHLRQMWAVLLRLKYLILVLLVSLGIVGLRALFRSHRYARAGERFWLLSRLRFPHWVAIFLLLILLFLGLMKERIKATLKGSPKSPFSRTFLSFVDRERMGTVFVFIVFLRAGEFMLTTMVSSFIVDLGMKVHYGWISAGVGLPASIVGALLGGGIIARYGLKRSAFGIILFQNSTNLMYMGLAFALSSAFHPVHGPKGSHLLFVALVHGVEQLSGGMGTAVLMSYLMSLCKKEFKAAHYAIGSGLMAVSGLFAGVASGFSAASFGYAYTFGLSFLVAAPALIALLSLPLPDRTTAL